MGKHKPIFDKGGELREIVCDIVELICVQADCGDYVCVTNARKVLVTGRKEDQIVYRHHTMYPGGLKEIEYKKMMERKPDEVRYASIDSANMPKSTVLFKIIRQAVSGMLPKNRLRDRRLERLRIFEGPENPLQANITKSWNISP